MTNRLLHTDAKGTTLEITDTGGIHTLVTTHEQGAATVILAVDIPAHMANGLIAATPVFGTPSTFAPGNHKAHWEKPSTPDPDLLRDALRVALRGHKPLDTDELADRAAGVVNKILHGAGNQVHPWTPEFAVRVLLDEDAAPHQVAAARGVLGLPLPEEAKREGATVNLDWQPSAGDGGYRVGLSRFRTTPNVPGPVMYGSPWSGPSDEQLIDAEVVDDDRDPWAGGAYEGESVLSAVGKPEKPGKAKGKKGKPGKVKPGKPEKGEEDKPEKGNAFGRRIALFRYVVDRLDGHMPFPDGPHARGFRFYTECVADVENFIEEHTVDALIYDPRGEAPSLGHGTPLDKLSVSDLLDLAASVDATAFESQAREPGAWFPSLEDAVKTVLHEIYVDVWSVIANGLAVEELTVNDRNQVELIERPAEEEPDEELPVE